MEDVVKLLLVIFNFYKPQISRDKTFKVILFFYDLLYRTLLWRTIT